MCGGEGSEILKGRVSHGQTCASRVQLLYPKGLNGFFDWGISKISYITSVFGLCVITAGIPCSCLVSTAQTD